VSVAWKTKEERKKMALDRALIAGHVLHSDDPDVFNDLVDAIDKKNKKAFQSLCAKKGITDKALINDMWNATRGSVDAMDPPCW